MVHAVDVGALFLLIFFLWLIAEGVEIIRYFHESLNLMAGIMA